MKTMVYGTFDVPKNMLESLEVRNTWVMHKEADLLNNISKTRTSKGDILQGPSEALIKSRIRDWLTGRRELGFGVRRSAARITRDHISTCENFLSESEQRKKKGCCENE